MPTVLVRIPRLLADVGDGRTEVSVEADTVAAAMAALFTALPQLKVHVIDESGGVRPHVSVFHDGHRIDAQRMGDRVADGTVVTILQAVSGGEGRPFPVAVGGDGAGPAPLRRREEG
jgi:sulfur-carrier protein adenylyltransferase/sulfurtransferase